MKLSEEGKIMGLGKLEINDRAAQSFHCKTTQHPFKRIFSHLLILKT